MAHFDITCFGSLRASRRLLSCSRSFHTGISSFQSYTRNVAVRSKVLWELCCASIGVALLMAASAAYAQQQQDIAYALTPLNDGIGDTLTGTIITDGTLGVLQGSDIVSFQFTYDLSAALTIDDHTPSIDVGTWGSSDPDAAVVNALEDLPTGIEATATRLTYVGGGNLWFVASTDTSLHPNFASAFFSNSLNSFSDIQGLEQSGIAINSSSHVIATAPEIDPASAAGGLTLLFGGLAVLRGRKRVDLRPPSPCPATL